MFQGFEFAFHEVGCVKVMNESLSHIEGSWAKEDYIVKVQGLGMLRFPYLTAIRGQKDN